MPAPRLIPQTSPRGVAPAAVRRRSDVYVSSDVALKLDRSTEWFYRNKAELIARGMPAPLDLPGHPRWSKCEMDAWLSGVDRRKIAGKPVPPPANDAGAMPAPEEDAWEPFLRAVYANA